MWPGRVRVFAYHVVLFWGCVCAAVHQPHQPAESKPIVYGIKRFASQMTMLSNGMHVLVRDRVCFLHPNVGIVKGIVGRFFQLVCVELYHVMLLCSNLILSTSVRLIRWWISIVFYFLLQTLSVSFYMALTLFLIQLWFQFQVFLHFVRSLPN